VSDDAKLDELFRGGLETAARPYARAAIAHRDEMLSPAPKDKLTTRVRDRGAGFASAHRRLIAALTAAAALTGAAAYAMPSWQSASGAKVDPQTTPSTAPDASASTVPGRGNGTRPGGASQNNDAPAPGTNAIVPPGPTSAPRSGNSATQPVGTTAGGTPTGGPTGPSGPPDSTAPPQYGTTNTVHAVLHDRNVLTVTAQNDGGQLDQWVNEGPVEIGFQDARTQPAHGAAVLWLAAVVDEGRRVTLTQAVPIQAGTTKVLHLVYVNYPYALSAHIGDAVVSGDNAFALHVAAATDINRNSPYLVKTTLDSSGFELTGTPALRQGDEPCLTSDAYVPTPGDVWVPLAMHPQQRPYLSIHNLDGRAWTLNIVGYGAYANGNLSKGKNVKFQLPPRPAGAPFEKYVLQYTLNDNPSISRTIVIWADPK
jgi:hypothetical protein